MSELILKQVSMPQGVGVFKAMFSEVFGREAWKQEFPVFLVVGYFDHEDEPIGFMSGIATDLQTFYMQRIGLVPRHRGEKLYLRFWGQVSDFIKDMGFRYITGTIRTDNPQPIIVAMHTGWRIHGFKVSTNGTQYIQVIKDLAEG
jgi:hypothetical protein